MFGEKRESNLQLWDRDRASNALPTAYFDAKSESRQQRELRKLRSRTNGAKNGDADDTPNRADIPA